MYIVVLVLTKWLERTTFHNYYFQTRSLQEDLNSPIESVVTTASSNQNLESELSVWFNQNKQSTT